ncbi:MAG TPA: hypothetical protein VND44_10520 [Acidimicrobiales bacterium]|nr:hypothetical protein [Acidimicrobiales bacterium]
MHRSRNQGDLRRPVLLAISVATGLLVLVLALVLTGSGTSAAHRCGTRPGVGLHAVQAGGGPSTTLPPSHDNDTGGAHLVDRTPDADVDANQRTPRCPT